MFKFYILFILCLQTFGSHATEISYTLVDLSSEKIIEQKNQDTPMVLASVSKIYTSFYALNKLNPNKTIPTNIYLSKDSKLKDNILTGDLIITGNGNPYFTVQNALDLIYQIKNYGIHIVKGRFIIDNNGLWSTSRLSPLGLEDQADNSAMGALNIEFNRFKVNRYSNQPIPNMDYLKISKKSINQPGLKFQLDKKTANSVHWTKNTNEKHSYLEELPARDSNMFFGYFFQYLAKQHGLNLPNPENKNNFKKDKLIASQESLPLYRLIELGIEYSNNLIAEMILQQTHPSSPLEASTRMIEWYKKNYPSKQFNWDKTKLVNGSGITLENTTTSKNLSYALSKMYKSQNMKRNFLSYLSISGHSGGISRRLRSPKLSYQVFAKTGSLFYVNNLAGYLRAKSGKLFAFSIFTTDSKNRDILNTPNTKKVNKIRKGAKKRHRKSTSEIDSLVESFINKY